MCHTSSPVSFEHAMTCCGYEVVVPVRTSSKAFAGRVAVVTGVGSGIGRALTYELAAGERSLPSLTSTTRSWLRRLCMRAHLVPPFWPIISTSPTVPQCCLTPRK